MIPASSTGQTALETILYSSCRKRRKVLYTAQLFSSGFSILSNWVSQCLVQEQQQLAAVACTWLAGPAQRARTRTETALLEWVVVYGMFCSRCCGSADSRSLSVDLCTGLMCAAETTSRSWAFFVVMSLLV